MEDREDLTTGVQLFMLRQHTISIRKALVDCAARHTLVVRGVAAPSLANTKTLTALDGATIPLTLAVARGMITSLRVVAAIIFGVTHGTT